MKPPLVYCIVVTYNGMRWIDRCLASLCTSSVPLKTIVIDNASIDGTAAHIAAQFPEVELIPNVENLGFGKANNIGLRKALNAKADYIFLLNQDSWITAETIEQLILASIQDPSYGILSPLHYSSVDFCLEKQFLQSLSDNITTKFINDCYFNKLKSIYTTQYVHAAAWLLTQDCLNTVGGFDPLFFHYGEDDDYMRRAKYFGFKLGIVTTASVTHDALYKTWEMVEWDKNRNLVISHLQLKNMAPFFRSNLLVFLKTTIDELTTLLIFRKWKKLMFKTQLFFTILSDLNLIYKSYKASFKRGSFCD